MNKNRLLNIEVKETNLRYGRTIPRDSGKNNNIEFKKPNSTKIDEINKSIKQFNMNQQLKEQVKEYLTKVNDNQSNKILKKISESSGNNNKMIKQVEHIEQVKKVEQVRQPSTNNIKLTRPATHSSSLLSRNYTKPMTSSFNKQQYKTMNTVKKTENLIDIVKKDNTKFASNRMNVNKNTWYSLRIRISEGTEYKKGLIKIFDEEGKNLILPTIRIPNILFSKRDKVSSIKELNELNEFMIYFRTIDQTVIQIYSININIVETELQKIDDKTIIKDIGFWRLRRLFDLEFLNYYLEVVNNNNIIHNLDNNFIERFKSEYKLSKNINLNNFENFITSLKLDLSDEKQNVNTYNGLYLIHSSILFENIGYTLRTHSLLKNTNNDNYRIYGTTRYGYPYDRPLKYYEDIKKSNNYDIDNVTYIKLNDGEDNYNDNTIEDYIKKYIKETIKLAYNLDAKVIHATTNYWNGITAIYAAKYLKVKSIYEIRGFWEESAISFQPEIYDSDILKMRSQIETTVMQKVDKVIVINNLFKDNLVKKYNIPEDKIEVVPNGVDTEQFKPVEDNKEQLIKELKITSDLIIGYIGSLLKYEGLEYIFESIKKIKNDHNIEIKFVIIGDGADKDELFEYSKKIKVNNQVIYLGKKDNKEVPKYYDLFDIVCYPRKDDEVCLNTSSSKIMEAMSMEKALIVSDLPAYRELVTEDRALFIQPNNVDDLIDKILKLYHDLDLRLKLGKNCRDWILENRDWKIMGNKLRQIYDNL